MRSFSFSLLTSSLLLLASLKPNPAWARIDTLRTFPEKRFVDGAVDFGQYLMTKLRYPLQAQQAAVMGTSLLSFVITPTGKLISLTIINSLGKAIDEEVIRVVQTTAKLWMPASKTEKQDSIILFLPFRFTLVDRSGDKDFYVETVKPDFILNEIVLVGYSSQITYTTHDDAYYIAQLTLASQKKDYKRMLTMVDELIRRNPYSDKLYFQRATIERELGQIEEACSDYKKIIYFLGKTHFPKHFLKNCTDLSSQGHSDTTLVQTAEYTPIEEEVFTVCEVPPVFPGGSSELDNYIRQHLHYPEDALNRKIQGKVLISFIVTKEGRIQDVSVLKGPGYGVKEEAVRLVQNMPNWNPGKQAGHPVNVKYNLVIPFKLKATN